MATRGSIMLAWDHWHIEPSSICTLKCPRCPRAELPESLLNRQLTLNFFKNQIGAGTVQQIKKITFCGNDGDPIYCKQFLEICEWIKHVNPEIQLVLITNGSHKTTDWWQLLANIFDANDEIHWSLDGWNQESNEQYRVNSNWDSISNGINTFNQHNTTTFRVWASIAFRFNEQHLLRQKVTAIANGFDSYQLTKSTKFGSKYPAYGNVDPLEPTDAQLVASGHRFERVIEALTTKQRPGNKLKTAFLQRAETLGNYSGICLIGNKGVFLNSQGEFYPCCWTANRYEHNQAWHNRAKAQFNLNERTFQEIIKDKFWNTEFLEFDSLECRTKCTPDRLTDRQHTTEW
jgi:MoaA/NifB/PqqE/SkfB family radical SAM enzyme